MTNFTNLEALATVLDTASSYNQRWFTHSCGTPACALGHWAASRKSKGLKLRDGMVLYPQRFNGSIQYAADIDFDISLKEANELFELDGCGNAQTAAEAAAYIRKFIARKRAEEATSA